MAIVLFGICRWATWVEHVLVRATPALVPAPGGTSLTRQV